jgi:lipid-A-disaccharide synthase
MQGVNRLQYIGFLDIPGTAIGAPWPLLPSCGAGADAPGAAVNTDALQQLDAELFLLVNRLDAPAWELVAGYGTQLGSGALLVLLLLVGLRLFDRRRFPKNFLLIGLAMAVAGLASTALKAANSRPRPLSEPVFELNQEPTRSRVLAGGLPVYEYAVGSPKLAALAASLKVIGPRFKYHSFPSGHTVAAFAWAAGLIYAFRSWHRWLFLLPAGFVGLSRVACGVHFPLDVLGGAALGSTVSVGFLRLFEIFHGLASTPHPPAPRKLGGPTRVMMVVGEASADLYGARILEALRRREPGLEAFGIGGERMQRAGLTAHGDAAQLEIVGFTAVLTSLRTIVRLYRRMLALLREARPDVLLCIDLPDFNSMLALQARARGVPVLFDISPQFWAWRSGRIDKLAGRISKMIVAFPFEAPYYERAGIPVAFHGHPLLEGLEPRHASREEALAHFGLDPERRTCVLAPGSRRSEWKHNVRALFDAAAQLQRELPDLQFAVPLAPQASEERMQRAAAEAGITIVCTRGDNYDLFRSSDFGLLCSGTATLEAALAELPMLIFYRGNWVNAILAKLLVEIDRIGLPNIVLGGDSPAYPELLQHHASARGLAEQALTLLRDEAALARLSDAGAHVRERLTSGATSDAVADDILALARTRVAAT